MVGRPLVVAVVLVVALTSVSVEANFLEGFQDQFTNFKDTVSGWTGNIKEKLGGLYSSTLDNLKSKFNNLSEKWSNWLGNQDMSNATAQEMVDDLSTAGWSEIRPQLLMSAKKVELEKLIDNVGPGKVPQRFLDELSRLLLVNLTNEELISKAKADFKQCEKLIATAGMETTNNCKMTLSEVVSLVSRFGDPRDWSAKNITDLGLVALLMPVCLDKIKDAAALQAVKNEIAKCAVDNPSSDDCPSYKNLDDLKLLIDIKLQGPPEDWTESDVTALGGILEVPNELIPYLEDQLITDVKNDITTVQFPGEDPMKCLYWKMALCRVEKCSEMDKDAAKTWYNGIGPSLKQCVTPSDLENGLDDQTLKDSLFTTVTNMGKDVMATDAKLTLDDKFKDKTPESITRSDVNSEDAHLMMRASACMIQGAATRGFLTNDYLKTMDGSVTMVKGPEYAAKLSSLMDANMKIAKSGIVFTYSSIIESLKPFIEAELLGGQSVNDLKQLGDIAQKMNQPLTPYQISVIIDKVGSTSDLQNFPPFLKEFATTQKMQNDGLGVLKNLAKDTSPFSLPCMMGAKKAFGDKVELTKNDLVNGKEFLRCMSAEDADKIKPDKLFEAFEAIKSTRMILSQAATRVLRDKLLVWGKDNLPTGTNSLENLGDALYLKDFTVIPPSVVADFGVMALGIMNRGMKMVVLMQLCGSGPDVRTVPQQSRRMIINGVVNEMVGEDGIGKCELDMLGFCALDLDAGNIGRLDEMAAGAYIASLQSNLSSGVQICLDKTQKDEIGKILLDMKGPTDKWRDASDVSCLLDTLSSTQLDALPQEVLTSTSCRPNLPMFEDGEPGLCKASAMVSDGTMSTLQIRKCLGMRGEAACDKTSCGGLMVMSRPEVEALTVEEVMDNLPVIGMQNMHVDLARVLLDKVKNSKKLADMTAMDISNLGFIMKALTKEDVADLPEFKYDDSHRGVVSKLGMKEMMFPRDVMEAVRDKILAEYKATSSMSFLDLVAMGQLMCSLTENNINAISNTVFLEAMRFLGRLDCDDLEEGTRNLAAKAVTAYATDNRPLQDWDAATLAEMDRLVGGMNPEDLNKIPAAAYFGMTPAAVRDIDSAAFPVFEVEQIKNINPMAAAAVSDDQKNKLNEEMREALEKAMPFSFFNLPGGTVGLSVSRLLGVVALVVAMLLA